MLLTVHEAAGKNTEYAAHLTKKEVLSTFKSPFVLLFVPAFFANGTILFGMSYFLPTVVRTYVICAWASDFIYLLMYQSPMSRFGYSQIQTQLHTVPVYVVVFACECPSSISLMKIL